MAHYVGVVTSVLIVDDERTFRAQAERLLELRGFEVAGQAGDGASAMQLARALRPGAVLLDVNLPDVSGLDVAREISLLPDPPRVLLTSADRELTEANARACGAVGFVAKDELPASDLRGLLEGAGGVA
jgi:DNA-binding NarL/FixJ family response regulator